MLTHSQRYEQERARLGGCPIELGVVGNLADNECEHGRLPGDPGVRCGCWGERSARVKRLAARMRTRPPAMPATAAEQLAAVEG